MTVQRNEINNFLSSFKILFFLISKDGNYRKLNINYMPQPCQMKVWIRYKIGILLLEMVLSWFPIIF